MHDRTGFCPACCRGFVFQANSTGPDPVYCSRRCRQWWTHWTVHARRVMALWADPPRCRVCEVPLIQHGEWPKRLPSHGKACAECRLYIHEQSLTARDRCRVPWRTCADCGRHFVAKNLRRRPHRCRPCAAQAQQITDARKNLKRRRARQGLTGATLRPLHVAELAARDGAVCHLCRRPVDMSLPGTHAMGPTRDHLVPVAHGGSDEPSNLALAHRSCNVTRRDRGTVQLRLTA